MCLLTSCRLDHRWVPANSLTPAAAAGPAVAVVVAEAEEEEAEEEEEALVVAVAVLAPPANHQARVAVGEAVRAATHLMVSR